MKQQISTTKKREFIKVSIEELQFIRNNSPKGFPRLVSEALTAIGYPIDRVRVHKELHTLKDNYDSIIILKTRELLKLIQKVEFVSE